MNRCAFKVWYIGLSMHVMNPVLFENRITFSRRTELTFHEFLIKSRYARILTLKVINVSRRQIDIVFKLELNRVIVVGSLYPAGASLCEGLGLCVRRRVLLKELLKDPVRGPRRVTYD